MILPHRNGVRAPAGETENAGLENTGRSKMQCHAGMENAALNCRSEKRGKRHIMGKPNGVLHI